MNDKIIPLIFSDKYIGLLEILSKKEIINDYYNWGQYKFNGFPVPRVSNILQSTTDKSGIIEFATRTGNKYKNIVETACDIGTLTHQMISDELNLKKIEIDKNIYSDNIIDKACIAFDNYEYWKMNMLNMGFVIVPEYSELTVVTPWFGGTLDAIVKIAGHGQEHYVLLDFKTSNRIDYTYFLQLAAYEFALEWLNANTNANYPEIDRIGIIRVDKNKINCYDTLFIDRIQDRSEFKSLRDTLISMIEWYYKQKYTEYFINK